MKYVVAFLWGVSGSIILLLPLFGIFYGLGWTPPEAWRIEELMMSSVFFALGLALVGFLFIPLSEGLD